MLVTQAEGWHDGSRDGRREKENEKNLSLSLTDVRQLPHQREPKSTD